MLLDHFKSPAQVYSSIYQTKACASLRSICSSKLSVPPPTNLPKRHKCELHRINFKIFCALLMKTLFSSVSKLWILWEAEQWLPLLFLSRSQHRPPWMFRALPCLHRSSNLLPRSLLLSMAGSRGFNNRKRGGRGAKS